MELTQVIADMQTYLRDLPKDRCPVSPDNWAALADMTYDEFRNVMRKMAPGTFEAYTAVRRQYRKDLQAAVLRLRKPTKQNLQPVMKRFDIDLNQVRDLCKRLKHHCPPRDSVMGNQVTQAVTGTMTFDELALATGLTRKQVVNTVYREVRRGHLRLGKKEQTNVLGAQVKMTIVRKVNHDS